MPRKKKLLETIVKPKKISIDIPKEQGRKRLARYYSPYVKNFIMVNIKDGNGNLIPKTHGITGAQLWAGNNPEYKTEKISFAAMDLRPNYAFCVFDVYTDTPKYVKEKLEELSEEQGSGIYTEDAWIKLKNPAQHAEMKRRLSVEQKLEDYKAENDMTKAKLNETLAVINKLKDGDTIDNLKKQLAELGG